MAQNVEDGFSLQLRYLLGVLGDGSYIRVAVCDETNTLRLCSHGGMYSGFQREIPVHSMPKSESIP